MKIAILGATILIAGSAIALAENQGFGFDSDSLQPVDGRCQFEWFHDGPYEPVDIAVGEEVSRMVNNIVEFIVRCTEEGLKFNLLYNPSGQDT